jgi:hypothetical protein
MELDDRAVTETQTFAQRVEGHRRLHPEWPEDRLREIAAAEARFERVAVFDRNDLVEPKAA